MKFINVNIYIWYLAIGVFISRLGTSITTPFIVIYLSKNYGINLFYAGIIVGIAFFAQIVGSFVGGMLSDYIGRKRLIFVSLFTSFLVYLAFGLTSQYIHIALIAGLLFALLNCIGGFARAWSETLAQTMIADYTKPENKQFAFSLRYTAANLGSVIGPVIGVYWGVSNSYNSFYISSIFILIYFLLFKIISDDKNTKFKSHFLNIKSTIKIVSTDQAFHYYIFAAVLIYMGYVQHEAILAMILMSKFHNIHYISYIFSLNALLIIIFQLPLCKFFQAVSPYRIVHYGVILLSSGLLVFGFSGNNISSYILGEIIFTFGELLIFPNLGCIIDLLAPESLRGTYFGIAGLQLIGRAIGPSISGIISDKINISSAFILIGLITLFGIYFLSHCSYLQEAKLNDQIKSTQT